MNNYFLKLKYILLPFLACMLLLIIGYSFWNWFLFIKLDWINLDDSIINIFIPLGIAVITALFYMKRSINRLYFKDDKKRDFIYLIVILGWSVPLIISQNYLTSATGSITHLRTISEIDQYSKTKYYTLDDYYLLKKDVSIEQNAETSGKNSEKLNFYIYSVVPIMETSQDTLVHQTHYWMCKRYQYQMSNYKSDEEKVTAFQDFTKRSQSEFFKERYKFTYLERLKNSSDIKFYTKATEKNKWTGSDENILLITKQGKFDDRSGKSFVWIFTSAGIALVVFLLLLLCFRLKTPEEWIIYNKKVVLEKRKLWYQKYSFIIPQGNNFASLILIYTNIIVFLWLIFSGLGFVSMSGLELIEKGSLYSPYIKLDGQYWRLFTYMFLHGGIMHILNNLLSLFFVGIILEPIIGRWKFITVYLICGIGAGITSLLWHDEVNTVGASGAIFGLYGFMIILILMKVTDKSINKAFLFIGSISLIISLITGMFGTIDNAAHIGGLLTGGLLGLLYTPILKQQQEE